MPIGLVLSGMEQRTPDASTPIRCGSKTELFSMGRMTKLLEEAVEEVSNLPEADQEKIGRGLLSHVEKLRRLRIEIDKGIRSLDAGEGAKLDLEEFIRQAKTRNNSIRNR
jgi:hypothetical protein